MKGNYGHNKDRYRTKINHYEPKCRQKSPFTFVPKTFSIEVFHAPQSIWQIRQFGKLDTKSGNWKCLNENEHLEIGN
jgi:hypothetical protein